MSIGDIVLVVAVGIVGFILLRQQILGSLRGEEEDED